MPSAPSVTDLKLCQFDAAQPITANGQNLRWFNTDGNAFGSAPTPSTDRGGNYAFQVTQTVEGCESTKATINVTVQTTPVPTVASSVVYCRGQESKPLSATGTGVSFEWTDPYGNVTPTAPVPPTLNVTDGVSYFVTQTGANGCKSPKAEIKFIVNATPTAALSGSSSVNLGQSAKLTLTFTSVPPFSFTLSDGTSGTSDAMTKTIDVLPKESTTYQVTNVSNVCGVGLPAGIANIVVRIPTITTGNLTASTVCAGTSISVPFTTTGDFNAGNVFQVELADTTSKNYIKLAQGGQQSPIVVTVPANTPQGLYFVRVTASNPSIPVPGKVSTTVLNIRALPTATLTGTRDIYEGESAKLNIRFTGDGPWDFVYADSVRSYPIQTTANPYEVTVTPARRTTYTITSVSNNCGTGTVSGTAIINVLPVLGVEPNPLVQALNAYPVPVETTLTVDIAMPLQQEAAKIQLMDANGKARLQTTTHQQKTLLDLTQQEAGLYLLHVQVGNHKTVRKILKR
ncbi:T9SS type A sorting domain-containing protein [Tellurirhabdus bombi]|uniref:T9SS type A sorting domain-containing protein n=1 Tax=Tellurirhabdus bombi TaxID=2907205 RepID=UPI001F17D862|nr:T9SS type A sorting domain-containing protein [Tellurirhabdus bombi]